MPTISNTIITIEVATKGAELQSIYHQKNQLEYVWQADPAVWAKHSPVLFPIVGELKDKKYTYKGKEYNLSRHGFAREMDFELTEQTSDSLTFTLHANAETQEKFPFQFTFSVKYTIEQNKVTIAYMVNNTGGDIMLFSVGAHPAFKVPIVEGTTYTDYQLVFDQKENAGRWPISTDGLIETAPTPLLQNQNILPLNKDLFTVDAIVFKHLQSKAVSITSPKTEHGVKITFEDFPYLGIWETKGGDFLCIEPWCGIADSVDASGNLEEKEGINRLHPGDTFKASYNITVF